MNTRYAKNSITTLIVACACFIMSVLVTPVVLAKEELPEVSSDGLHLIRNSNVRVAYAKPGTSLSKYTKLIILDCFVEFKEDWKHDFDLKEVGLSGRVADKDMDQIKSRLAK